ncbi:MAG: hypothetical protein KGI00_03095 [Candidatus Micrarchaeota archaeon]|nr:hypothetical protein [Candidatus Micrarchaeota archaeon]MDE1824375.1 hypothetical protein [Candidatus Micrarchaeota archaeon]MDE1849691.1 hypothetical protein [Candidatus Micrarchaeota archaeon]
MVSRLTKLGKEIELIKERNRKVEIDKAWETSYSRRLLLIVFTYLAIGLYLQFIVKLPNAWLSAIVPSAGFLLSTLTLPFFKGLWVNGLYKAKKSPRQAKA